jgi:Holliday junction resolvase RusA-like endonuclease
MSTRDIIYNTKYSTIPENYDDRIELLFQTKNPNRRVVIQDTVNKNIKVYKRNKINKFSFVWYSIPVPCKRPRVNVRYGYPQIYVPDARKNLNDFEKFFKKEFSDFKIIDTPMSISIKGYTPTPTNFNKIQKILAEMKILKPWGRVFDTDNFYKAAVDQIVGTVIIDDSLIDTIHGYKYYSIKPRIEYEIKYLDKFPEVSLP